MAQKYRGVGTLDSLSTAALQAELRRRTGALVALHRRRERAAKKVAEIDALIAQHGGAVKGGPARFSNTFSLVETMRQVLKGKTMGVSEVADAVRAAGYTTTSPNFRVIDFQIFTVAYNNLECPAYPARCPADLNGDGVVDDLDFQILSVNYDYLVAPFRVSIGFGGYVADESTGLLLARNRWYDPNTGRWLTQDPSGYRSGMNLFEYCNGGPIRMRDPLGLEGTWSDWVGLRGTGVGNWIDNSAEGLGYSWTLVNEPVQSFDYSGAVSEAFDRAFGDPYAAEARWQMEQANLVARASSAAMRGADGGPCAQLRLAMASRFAREMYGDMALGQEFANIQTDLGLQAVGMATSAIPVGSLAGGISRFAGRLMSPGGILARMRVPWSFGSTPGALGSTDKFGNITIRAGLSGRQLQETIAHESVHRFFSPRVTSFAGNLRATVGMEAYGRSHLVRFAEEALAESWATGSVRQGLLHTTNPAYGLSTARIVVESTAYVSIVGGAGTVGYQVSPWKNP